MGPFLSDILQSKHTIDDSFLQKVRNLSSRSLICCFSKGHHRFLNVTKPIFAWKQRAQLNRDVLSTHSKSWASRGQHFNFTCILWSRHFKTKQPSVRNPAKEFLFQSELFGPSMAAGSIGRHCY